MNWTKEQIDFLIKNYPIRGKKWCVDKLGLKEHQVRYKASALGLKIDKNSKLLNYDNKSKGKHFKGKKRPEHSKRMKELVKKGVITAFKKREKECFVTSCEICGKEIKTYLPKNSVMTYTIRKTCSDVCKNKMLSIKKKKDILKNGHPKGMLGKTHSKEYKDKISKRSKLMWSDKNSYFNSEENKQRISDNNMKLHKKGILGGENSYSNCKRGYFIDGDKKYYMRSGWEIRYAAYLNILKKSNEIKDWEYEVDTFWFEKIKRGVRSYKPDFKIFNNDGSIVYHEVKGYMDAKSKTKLKRMKLYHPEINVIVIGEEFFKKNKNIIPSYEYSIKKYS
jgi:hypothetical protein